ncbi:MAG TPA: zf-HC2 domain-containing protein, partial [Gemmatimonadaceae bacterium]
DPRTHLTEAERHAFVDDEMTADERRSAEAHLAICRACADDINRLEGLVTRARSTPIRHSSAALDELWPTVRARIDSTTVASVTARALRVPSEWRRSPWLVGLTAALIVGVIAPIVVRTVRHDAIPIVEQAVTPANGPVLSAVADSERLYQQEAQMLLNRLELERSMLRPETVKSVDRDLRVIDKAIAELKDAIARDPNNPALHQLLASSYRQKAELLKRVSNAG